MTKKKIRFFLEFDEPEDERVTEDGMIIHPDWPSEDLEEVGWAAARRAIKVAKEMFGINLYAEVSTIEKEDLAIIALYCEDTNTIHAFGIGTNPEYICYPMEKELYPLMIPILELFVVDKTKQPNLKNDLQRACTLLHDGRQLLTLVNWRTINVEWCDKRQEWIAQSLMFENEN